jgi:hypothetical protein
MTATPFRSVWDGAWPPPNCVCASATHGDPHCIVHMGRTTAAAAEVPHADCMPGWCVLPPSDPRHENHPAPHHGDPV